MYTEAMLLHISILRNVKPSWQLTLLKFLYFSFHFKSSLSDVSTRFLLINVCIISFSVILLLILCLFIKDVFDISSIEWGLVCVFFFTLILANFAFNRVTFTLHNVNTEIWGFIYFILPFVFLLIC